MKAILHRLETGQRWPAADLCLRLAGAALLSLCALAVAGLFRSVHQIPRHEPSPVELIAGLAVVQSWCLGTALFAAGQGLFEPVILPRTGTGTDFPFQSSTPPRLQEQSHD
ncbi:MAG: hypothetical protein BGO57_05475 [Sphingomonadales bacterium 63-6]|nr:MAG: hypothetical protein BGO57_05475 [Sphingomonadales bacterium 63-6]